MQLTESRRRAIGHGLALVGVIIAIWGYVILGDDTWRNPGADALVYWAVDPFNPYVGSTVGGENAYLYSPAFAQLFMPLAALPREVFVGVWIVLLAAVAVWLARPWPLALVALLLPVSQEVMIGNIHLLLAASIVVGFRWPAAWAFVLLTKVTPGIGLLWFLVRREWKGLFLAGAATVVVAAASFAIAPSAWFDWIALLRRDGGTAGLQLAIRLTAAAAIVTWGALTDRRWTVPLVAMLALPVVWMDSFSMLLGCVAVSGDRWRSRRDASNG